jgi:hypothetical protein
MWISSNAISRNGRLDDHRAERVGEHVVELDGDALALRPGRALPRQSTTDARALGR